MKKIIKTCFFILCILYLILFLNKNNYYYENESVLTSEAIERFEKDLKEGKEIIPSNYMPKKKEYNNRVSRFGLKCSSLIEKGVNKVLRRILDSLENQ